ncbi:MAG: hypothetical protein HDS06_05830 [Bacteroides sp.]|nr:hypothetical protein [Bacteroides sp.]
MERIIEETVIMIVNYFDSVKWKYEVKEEEDMIIFETDYRGENEYVRIRVIVFKWQKRNYHVWCYSNTTIPKEHIMKGLQAVNQYNSRAVYISVFLNQENGDIIFRRHHESNEAIPEADFIDCFATVVNAADCDTAQIFKNTLKL